MSAFFIEKVKKCVLSFSYLCIIYGNSRTCGMYCPMVKYPAKCIEGGLYL